MRRMVRVGVVATARALDALSDYLSMPLTRHGHPSLLGRVFELRDNFTASDATYVALCERLGATLVTCDAHLTRAVKGQLSLNVVGVS